jgi:hypothetical protein
VASRYVLGIEHGKSARLLADAAYTVSALGLFVALTARRRLLSYGGAEGQLYGSYALDFVNGG